MKRIIIRDHTPIPPFGEPARDLRILNKPLWLTQRDLLARYCKGKTPEINDFAELAAHPVSDEELLIYRDNLLFNAELIEAFITTARASQQACQIAFALTDRSINVHALPLQEGIRRQGDVYIADLYYFPPGPRSEPQPLVIDTQAGEMGYYHIPSYMASQGDLIFQVPVRVFLSIENWVHVFIANTPFGVFAWARQTEATMLRGRLSQLLRWTREDWQALGPKLRVLFTSFLERINPFEDHWRNHFLASKALVKVGKNCSIDPSAVIHGPTVIGDNVYIGPGTVIANSLIGSNVNIMQGCQVMLSVVSDRCFLPFNAGLFMSTLMDNSMVAQNSTLQLCVIGRNTFIGANNCFTDFNLLGSPIRTWHKGQLHDVNLPVLGSAVGHNCKIGSGFVVYPGRTIGSNSVIIFDHEDNLIRKTVSGLSPDDVDEATGEPRRVVYRWPNVYEPDDSPPTLPPEAFPTTGPDNAATLELSPNRSPSADVRYTRRIDL